MAKNNSLTHKIYHKTFNELYIWIIKYIFIYFVKKKSKEFKIWICSIIINRALFQRNSYSFKISNLLKRNFFMKNYHLDSNPNFNNSSNYQTKKINHKITLKNCNYQCNIYTEHSMHYSPFDCIGNLQRSFSIKKTLLTAYSRRISNHYYSLIKRFFPNNVSGSMFLVTEAN